MAGGASEEPGTGMSLEGKSSGQQRCQSGDALAEWRSSEQVENGTPSTSPPYWDTDDDDDCGPKPSQLYGKYTWKIDKFSQINKRELRSNPFEVGSYKWYILIYPQGCDVCNHLSLFLCVANHEKLLPGWSHFAQFTIAVVNKDPKKSKYSDTLHRFWKKEHDWGWKKFMELSKVLDGFIDADTLIIKAQVQVIRERANRPFRCLDCQYRRELVRVYLTNVEQICRRFVEERRGKIGKLIEDKARWLSFRAFWLGIDQNTRHRMSKEKADSILKVVVKHFFIEKEVTSTLVMDSLYSGLKALEGQTKSKTCRVKYLDAEESPVPIVCAEKDMFVLVDDVLQLLERAAVEPLPPKDEKGPQNRTKDGSSGEDFNKDSIERDERRLTELGRRTIEIFVLAHIFSKIEVAYQEAVALKRQEELIREEEAAWLAGSEQKAKRGATEKEKKLKKKQGKQKRNNRKGKDKGKDEKPGMVVGDKPEQENLSDGRKDFMISEAEPMLEKSDTIEYVSDVSDSVDCTPEILQPDSEDRDASPVNWDTDTSEVHHPIEAGSSAVHNAIDGKRSPSVTDDSSSTCSTDSVPSVVMIGAHKRNPSNQKSQKSPSRGRYYWGKTASESKHWDSELNSQPFEGLSDTGQLNDASGSGKSGYESQAVVLSFQDRIKRLEQHVMKKDEIVSMPKNLCIKDGSRAGRPLEKMLEVTSPSSPPERLSSATPVKSEAKINVITNTGSIKKPSLDSLKQAHEPASTTNSAETKVTSKSEAHNRAATLKLIEKSTVQKVPSTSEKSTVLQMPVTAESPAAQQAVTTEKPIAQQAPAMSRPLSAPLVPGPRPTAPVVCMVQTMPLLSRSVSAAGRLGPEPSPATHSYVPQSYRNAMMGNPGTANSVGFNQLHSPNTAVNLSHSYSQPPPLMSAPMFLPESSDRVEPNSVKTSFSFGMENCDVLQNGPQWLENCPSLDGNSSMHCNPSPLLNGPQNLDLYSFVHGRSLDHFPSKFPAGTSGRQAHGVLGDEFPHLDIINDLLDDEHGIGKANPSIQSFSNGVLHLSRQFSFPGEICMSSDTVPSTSSGQFERTISYHDDGFQHGYCSSGGHFDPLRNMISQGGPQHYMNGQIDGLVPNQWPMAASDLSLLAMRNTESDGYAFHIPDYSNLARGINGYTVFRPSNGH